MAYPLEINMSGQKLVVFVHLLISVAKSKNNRNASQQDCQHLKDGKLQNVVILRSEVLTELLIETDISWDFKPYLLVNEY
jgi:hypothetical protein